jgi:hypothetical protein
LVGQGRRAAEAPGGATPLGDVAARLHPPPHTHTHSGQEPQLPRQVPVLSHQNTYSSYIGYTWARNLVLIIISIAGPYHSLNQDPEFSKIDRNLHSTIFYQELQCSYS